jgi:hypothetical protein
MQSRELLLFGIVQHLVKKPVALFKSGRHLLLRSHIQKIHSRKAAGQGKELLVKEGVGGNDEGMGLGAEHTGNRQTELSVVGAVDR